MQKNIKPKLSNFSKSNDQVSCEMSSRPGATFLSDFFSSQRLFLLFFSSSSYSRALENLSDLETAKKSVSLFKISTKKQIFQRMFSDFTKNFRNSFRKIRKSEERVSKRTQSLNINRSYSTDAHIYSASFMGCQEAQNNSITQNRFVLWSIDAFLRQFFALVFAWRI